MGMKQILLSSFLSILLLANIVSAQIDYNSILGTISYYLIQFSGLIFILIFILILLFVGGVIKLPRLGGGFSLGVLVFIILLVLVFFIPQFITFPDYLIQIPPSFMYWPLPPLAVQALMFIGLPPTWGWVPAIIYLFIIPFAAIFTLVWAFLSMLGIFKEKNINRVLAFLITFLTIPIGWFIKMVWALFAFMGIWSVAVFAATFIIGVFFRGAGVVSSEYTSFQQYSARAKKEREQVIEELKALKGKRAVGVMHPVIDAVLQRAQALGLSFEVQNLLKTALLSTNPDEIDDIIDTAAKLIKAGR
jgi:hypothetical protein